MSDTPRAPLAELALVAIAAVWGLTFVMVQDAVERIPVMTFLAYRFIPAAALVGLIRVIRRLISRRRLARLSRAGWLSAGGMGVFLTAGYVFQTLGLERTTAANAGFITGLFVVLTPIFGALFFRQRAGGLAWLSALVSAFGLYLLSGTGGDVNLVGDALVLGCAASFAFHILLTGRAVEDHDVGALLAVQLGVCGGFCLIVAGAQGDLVMPRSSEVWSALVVTSLFASALGFFVQTYAQQNASPARTALILASEPAFAGAFAYVLQDEKLTSLDWLGAGLILTAIVAVELVPHLRPRSVVPG